MIPPTTVETVKRISIVNYLLSLGVQPVKTVGHQFLYYSPLKEEKTPSFYVEPKANVFKDFTTDEQGGDIIALVRRLHNCSFREAIEKLQSFDGTNTPLSFSGYTAPTDTKKSLVVTAIQPLEHKGIWQYLSERCISEEVANEYLKEVHFKYSNRRGFAIGFANDKDGYELRSKYFKFSMSPKAITTIEVPNSIEINLFEGFFDFLSACQYYGRLEPRNTTIVLNSLSQLNNALIDQLRGYQRVNCYLDRDEPGMKAFNRLLSLGISALDCSKIYQNNKDFNEFLINQ